MDPDDELVAHQLANAEDFAADEFARAERHRCPIDMPPCPECQERDDEESFAS
jgi:hypothetical protein